jgi:hypothetical protein
MAVTLMRFAVIGDIGVLTLVELSSAPPWLCALCRTYVYPGSGSTQSILAIMGQVLSVR